MATYKLRFLKLSDESKLEIFKGNLSEIIADWATTIENEQQNLDYTSFIEALKKLRTSALASKN